MNTLLHVCCGPCASACVPRLKDLGREVTLLFANSNIDTHAEYEKRLGEAKKLAAAEGIGIVALPYDHESWLRAVAAGHERDPEKGERCARCFRYNLRQAADFAAAHGFEEFTTSLTVSPHKVSKMVFAAGAACATSAAFLAEDFKKREGFKLSVKRTAELGLYRQSYCGCEFSKLPRWRVRHREETVSTNLDARAGAVGDVFTADCQRAGRGRLDHKWHSSDGMNLMMSAVLAAAERSPEEVATLPLVAGLAVARAVDRLVAPRQTKIKWPNDVYLDGRKISGILCERTEDRVIVGIGVNVGETAFPPELLVRATSLAREGIQATVAEVRDEVLWQLGGLVLRWRERGFAAIHSELAARDFLKGSMVEVRQTDEDRAPLSGLCGGICPDGALDVAGCPVYAGEVVKN